MLNLESHTRCVGCIGFATDDKTRTNLHFYKAAGMFGLLRWSASLRKQNAQAVCATDGGNQTPAGRCPAAALAIRHTADGGRQLRPVRFSVRSPTTAARYQRGKRRRRRRQSASRKKSRPSAARLAVSSQDSPVKPSPQNKWLEPTHLKLQGAPKQKMLSCFSQSAI